MRDGHFGVVILGGGEATRLPNKLALASDDELPLIVRVYRNVCGAPGTAREIVVAGKATFPAHIDARLPVPIVVDRWNRRGPLAGLLTAMGQMQARFVFAVAGDAPFVDDAFIQTLNRRRLAGCGEARDVEAVVPIRERGGQRQIEPLAALYDRLAFVREGLPVLRSGRGSLRVVIARLRTRFVPMEDARAFTNVNTPADYAALRAQTVGDPP